jgi:murein DD-endopeptidase MepM/ murein hydrolase activator NlpD
MKVPVTGRLTSTFDEPRPLSNPGEHPHGAWDIAAKVGTPIHAPEAGKVYLVAIFRNELENGLRPTWDEMPGFPWQNYFYDVYGALIVLEGASGMVHIMAHSYFEQLHDKGILPSSAWEYTEEHEDKRWPIHCMHTLSSPYLVGEGEIIGYVGNAGYSTGAHCHWEIHNDWQLDDYIDRVDPATLELFS